MSSNDQTAIVLKVAEKDEYKAAQLFDQQRQHYMQQKIQVEKIESYIKDYNDQISTQPSGAVVCNLHLMESQRNYLYQLDVLLKAQQESLTIIHQQLEKARVHWQAKHLKRLKIQEMAERIAMEVAISNEKQQQQKIDDSFFHRHRESPF